MCLASQGISKFPAHGKGNTRTRDPRTQGREGKKEIPAYRKKKKKRSPHTERRKTEVPCTRKGESEKILRGDSPRGLPPSGGDTLPFSFFSATSPLSNRKTPPQK